MSKRFLILLVVFGWLNAGIQPATAQQTEVETETPIKHLIFLMQENHSFDNYFGSYPGADGIPEGVCMPLDPTDPNDERCVEPFLIGSNDVQLDDPDHSEATSRIQYNDGKMDGFVYALNLRNQDGRLAMGYYDGETLPFHWNVADDYVLFDRFFSSASGGSFINHMYWVSGAPGAVPPGGNQQDVLAETVTIFDRLESAGISWKFYVQNYEPALNYRTADEFPGNRASQVIWVPLLNFDRFLDDPNLNSHIVNLDEYFDDLANDTLPDVAFMVPSGPSEHPPSNLLSGQRFIKSLVQALMSSSSWESSAIIWSYDDWGGWYDHVPPPQVDEYGYGFRVPALLVSPYAKQGYIDSTTLDYTSALRFIEDNWGLEPMAERDAQANSLTQAFDFEKPPRPPSIISDTRGEVSVKMEPKRGIIYLVYGGGMLLAFGLLAIVLIHDRRNPVQEPTPVPSVTVNGWDYLRNYFEQWRTEKRKER